MHKTRWANNIFASLLFVLKNYSYFCTIKRINRKKEFRKWDLLDRLSSDASLVLLQAN